MRFWHYKILPVLSNKMIVSQWREIVAIKRQWEKGTLNHGLVNYVKEHHKCYFLSYTNEVIIEMFKRNIKFNGKLYNEIYEFCEYEFESVFYPEHDKIYLRECLYNLEEKARRGIVTKDEWKKIYNKFSSEFDLWKVE